MAYCALPATVSRATPARIFSSARLSLLTKRDYGNPRGAMMGIVWLRILSVLFTALALVFGGAHLFELPHKIGMSAADYLTVQQIYRGWQLAGIVVVGQVVSIALLAYAVRHSRRVFIPTVIALLCADSMKPTISNVTIGSSGDLPVANISTIFLHNSR